MTYEQAAKQFGATTFDGVTYVLTQHAYVDDAIRANAIDKDGNEFEMMWDISRLTSDDGQELELDDINYAIADDMRQI